MTSDGTSMWMPNQAKTPRTMQKDAPHPPSISIVLTSINETAQLRRCVETLAPCWAEARAEVIVVHAGTHIELASLAQQFSTIAWVVADAGTLESDLRRIGLERSSRDVVLFLNDSDAQRQQWAATLCRNWSVWTEAGGRLINAPTCGGEESCRYPYLSVVVPARNGGPKFLSALQALALSDLPRQFWELVIVDDASNDETAVVAAQYADKVLRLRHGPCGPGYARNRGFELTLGECVAFVNADVMVEANTLRNALTFLAEHADVGAVFGSCDASPMTRGFLSQYRSLVQRYFHHTGASYALTFSSACGMVRSSVFERAGGYDEWHFSRRQLEDLEFAQRVHSLGERIVLHTDVRATHLRKWTLRRMISTEIFDRAVPWMRLVERQLTKHRGGAQRTRAAKNVNIVLSWLAATSAILAFAYHSVPFGLTAVGCLAVVLVNNAPQLAFFTRERGVRFAVASAPLDILYYLIAGVGLVFGWVARMAVGEPMPGAVTQAFAEMGLKRWPPVPVKRVARPSNVPDTRSVTPPGPPNRSIFQPPLSPESPGDSSQPLQ